METICRSCLVSNGTGQCPEHKEQLTAARGHRCQNGNDDLAEAPHHAGDQTSDAVLGESVAERVVPDEELQALVPRQRPGAVQDGRRRGHWPARCRGARREPRDRPQEQREKSLHVGARKKKERRQYSDHGHLARGSGGTHCKKQNQCALTMRDRRLCR
jgi:hypothetical protein